MAAQEQDRGYRKAPRTFFGRLAENVLVGTIESIARAGAKAIESLTGDAAKVIAREHKKVDGVRKAVEGWRKETVGEIAIEAEEEKQGDRK